MSVDRAPIQRPSLPGIVGDSAGRVRGLEASSSMPYCYGQMQFQWTFNECMSWMEDWTNMFSTCLTITYVQFVEAVPGYSNVFYTTDPTIFSPVPLSPLQDPDNGTVGGIYVAGGGLFWWMVDVQIFTDNLFSSDPDTRCEWWSSPPTGASYALQPEAAFQVSPRQYGLFGSTDQGIRSVNGYRETDAVVDGSFPPQMTPKLTVSLNRVDAATELTYTVTVAIVRWSPQGFFYQV